ncbi:superoxide dismutase [Novosphingobium rosa]|uniref:superoxide dismutase n=1 Tax=Novosphingobium rosa TaxID=76978 RepID=UPI00082988AD|nr:superoxide dismutase [Novosphingobium rosa]
MPIKSRRAVLQAMAAAGSVMLDLSPCKATEAVPAIDRSPLSQPALPFAVNALEPFISARTIGLHFNKHHASYFAKLSALVAGTPQAQDPLEDIILASAGQPSKHAIFENAAQAWNHNLYWQSLSPTATSPSARLAGAIKRDFGNHDALLDELAKVTAGEFGSGWGWLVLENGKLRVTATSNAGNPMMDNQIPLLVIDVWEHAYYLDVQNRRSDYVNAVTRSLLNWRTASLRFEHAEGDWRL